jgi:acyl-CoA synthetase (AMP-forming)/AMP-acid ligase II
MITKQFLSSAQNNSADIIYTDEKGDIHEHLSYNDLAYNVLKLRKALVSKYHLNPGDNFFISLENLNEIIGDKVLLIYEPGLNFVVCFLACLSAGIVAVPVRLI